MVLDLNSLISSLPAKQEQKQLQELEQRRREIIARFPEDSTISTTKDPRVLNSVGQCMYIIRCLEHGLTKPQIVDLFYADSFTVETIINVIGVDKFVTKNK